MRKTTLQLHLSCSVQKTAPKNSKYSKNDRFWKMAKIGHHAKAIAFPKWSVWVENYDSQNHAKKTLYNHTRVVLCKKRLQEGANI